MKFNPRLPIILVILLNYLLSLSTPALSDGYLLQETDLEYKGAFRVPKGNLGGMSTSADTLGSGGKALCYNQKNNSLFMIGNSKEKVIVEISIPTPVKSPTLADLPTASLIQTPIDITSGNWNKLRIDKTDITNGGVPGGMLLYKDKLVGSAYAYYDGAYEGALSHFTASPNWSTEGAHFQGMFRVGKAVASTVNGGFVGGYRGSIPTEWQSILGGPVMTGAAGLAVISRSSLGPSAWVFDPDNL